MPNIPKLKVQGELILVSALNVKNHPAGRLTENSITLEPAWFEVRKTRNGLITILPRIKEI